MPTAPKSNSAAKAASAPAAVPPEAPAAAPTPAVVAPMTAVATTPPAGPHAQATIVLVPPASLKVGRYQVMPPRSDAEMLSFQASVRVEGVREPVEVDEEFTLIDGHTRVAAAIQVGLAAVPCRIVLGLDHAAKLRRAYGQAHRRHLTAAQRSALAERVLAQFSEYSNGYVATLVPVTDRTIAKLRCQLILAGQIEYHAELIGLDGQRQAAQARPDAAKSPAKKLKRKPAPSLTGQLVAADGVLTVSGIAPDRVGDTPAEVTVVRGTLRSEAVRKAVADALTKRAACLVLPPSAG